MNLTADAISSALVHSLWQNAIVGVLLGVVLAALRHRTANVRYLTGCGALAVMVVIPVVTAIMLSESIPPVSPITPLAVIGNAPASHDVVMPGPPVWVETAAWHVALLAKPGTALVRS